MFHDEQRLTMTERAVEAPFQMMRGDPRDEYAQSQANHQIYIPGEYHEIYTLFDVKFKENFRMDCMLCGCEEGGREFMAYILQK
jgi:hypothetical protein